ncbi:MAG: hypothetical protein HFJ41_04050 [Clostridia bacterium]|nr:hypothetical protein [Clostridia bacterium]
MKKENEIIEEILKKCNWWERIIVNRNKKLFVDIYRKGMQDYFNFINKN